MFFENPSAILLLKSTSLDIYSKEKDSTETISFLEETIKHLEVINKNKLSEEITSVIKGLKPQKSVMLLSDEVIFQKTLEIFDSSKTDIEKEEFFDKIPFAPEKIARKEIQSEKTLYLFSTNKELYKSIVEIFAQAGWTVDIVAPVSVFPSLSQKNEISQQELNEILDKKDILKKANFIEDEEYVVSVPDQEEQEVAEGLRKQQSWHIRSLVLGIIITILLGGLGVSAYQFRQQFTNKATKTDAQKIIEESLSSPSPEAIASTSAIPVPVAKEALKLQILNGSGVAGEAGKIKARLQKLGFKEIDTGNSPFDNRPEAVASYSAVVSQKERGEVKEFLDSNFSKVLESEATNSAKYDITIITGTKVRK